MKNLFSKVLISVTALIVGYGAMVLPFRLFDNLTGMQMRILFFSEMIVYFAIVSAFFLIREAKAEKEKRKLAFQERHNRRVEKRNSELRGIRVNDYEIAA